MGRGATLSELLDTLVPGTGQSEEPDFPGGPSAFDRFLDTLVPGDPPPDDFNRALLYAVLGSGLTLVSAVVLSLLPSKETILGSGFYAVGRRTLANVMGVAGDAAMPVAIFGAVLLLLTGVVALIGRRDGFTGALYVVQPVVGVGALGGAGLGWAMLIAVIAINLVVWIALIALVVVVGIAFLFGMIGAALDG
jgi:hypothetical protein